MDGVEIGRIRRGEQIETNVTPGEHVLTVAIDWKNNERRFSLTAGKTRHFTCAPNGDATPTDVFRDLADGSQWVAVHEVTNQQ